jgi:ABC-type oligopeptide transport system substrate-binding subunit
MRKKLIILAFALAAAAASTLTPASAQSSTCKKDEHLIVCPTYSFCCPNNAFCVCAP